MQNLSFDIDFIAFAIAVPLILLLFFLFRLPSPSQPSLLFSDLALMIPNASLKSRWCRLPNLLSWTALILLMVAFIDPHFYWDKGAPNKDYTTEGIAIYLVLDRSGSMATQLPQKNSSPNIPKIELLKQITEQFIKGNGEAGLAGRSRDLIGLVAFARTPQVLSPLTLDHARIIKELRRLAPVTDKNQDGTAIGYALYKTVHLIAATRQYMEKLPKDERSAYEIKNSVIILVTDGFDSPHADDLSDPIRGISPIQSSEFAQENQVRIYIINIDPALASSQFALYRRQMEKIANLTGGKYYLMTDPANLSSIYADIDKLEKSLLPVVEGSREVQPQRYERISLYPSLIGLSILCLLLAAFSETVWLRPIP